MTLILKSNAKMKVTRATDVVPNAAVEMYFSEESYKKGSQVLSLLDVIETNQASETGYYDVAGNYKTVAGLTPRVGFGKNSYKKGLVVEPAYVNHFRNSFTPVSHSISLTVGAGAYLVMSIIGRGSVDFYCKDVLVGTVTETSPKVYHNPLATNEDGVAIRFEVTGDVEYASLDATLVNNRLGVTRIQTGGGVAATKSGEALKVKRSLLDSVLTEPKGAVVIKFYSPSTVFSLGNIKRVVDVKNIVNGYGTYAAFNDTGNVPYQLRTSSASGFQGRTLSKGTDFVTPPSKTMAMSFGEVNRLFCNGEKVGEIQSSLSSSLDMMLSIGGKAWSEDNMKYVESLVIYSRELTDDELLLLSNT